MEYMYFLSDYVCTIVQVIVGVHSDESYVKLKHKHTIDNTEKRMSNVKKYADQVMGRSSTIHIHVHVISLRYS